MSIEQLTGATSSRAGLEQEMRSSYLDYAMSVIVGRALPDVRDGLKPGAPAGAVQHVRVRPAAEPAAPQVRQRRRRRHGELPPARRLRDLRHAGPLGQDFAHALPADRRPGQLRLDRQRPAGGHALHRGAPARLATEMLRDIDADTVDFGPNYDESRQEPLVLPARFPNLLVNGSSGIAVGMATNIPPHNLARTIDAVVAYIDDPAIDVKGLMKHIKGPDFPTGGIIVGHGGIRDAYETGRGRVVVRGRAHIEPMERGKERIIVTEMPFQVYKGDGRGDGSGLMQKIVEQVQNGRLKEISDLRDESDKSGIRLVIELKRDAIPKVVLNKLYKHTQLQTTFGVNMVALVDGVPRTLGLLPIVKNYVDHQTDIIVRRTKYELREKEARLHILEGLLVAIENIDEVIELIRASSDPDVAATA
jgi:DNA gyrase subunit A